MDKTRENTATIKLAAAALPLILVGQQQSNRAMLQDGLRSYSRAMNLLARDIQAHQTPKQMIQSILACVAMQNIELMHTEPICTNTWLAHTIGICSLMSRTDPRLFQDELHSIFLLCRTLITTVALCVGVPTFFMHEPWASVPFEKVSKDVHTQLFDVMAQLPGLLALASQFGDIDRSSAQFVTAEVKLIKWHAAVYEGLVSWHARLDSTWKQTFTRTKSAYWPGSAITFTTAGHANVWIQYWTALLTLHLAEARAAPYSTYFASCVDVETGAKVAEDICASEGYLTAPQHGAMSTMFYAVPLKKVMRFYDAHAMDDEKQMVLEVAIRTTETGLAITKAIIDEIPRDHPVVRIFEKVVGTIPATVHT
ncbi:hypothetical protein VHEMI04688 [[Torrubiella] hemipterigena]|nr:hypothetical protein VHEMI04688 [[Torrubiella] hemipterigena]